MAIQGSTMGQCTHRLAFIFAATGFVVWLCDLWQFPYLAGESIGGAIVLTYSVSALMSWLLASARGPWLILDIPNERSLHTRPMPRTGGIALLLGISAGLFAALLGWGYTITSLPLVLTVIFLALIALLDDAGHRLRTVLRFLLQIVAVAFLLSNYHIMDYGLPVAIITLLFLVWMTNLYNFMDGMDGFAGGMGIFGFGTFAFFAWQAGSMELAFGCTIVVAACAGFLMLNFAPAKLFMGDVGSTVLGLLAGVMMIQSHIENILPIWLGGLVFSPFIVDASITISKRMMRGERFWLPHKTHYYQRIVQLGWGHKRTVLAGYALMLACSGSAVYAAGLDLAGQWLVIGLWGGIYLVLMLLVSWYERKQQEDVPAAGVTSLANG